MPQHRICLPITIALPLLLFCIVVAQLTKQGALPTFAPSKETQSYFLSDSQSWIPSGSTQMTVLSGDVPLNMEIRMTGDSISDELESYTLLYKCSTKNADFQLIILDSKNNTGKHFGPSNTHCENQQGFFVDRLNRATYQIRIIKESNVQFARSLEHIMEFQIMVSYKKGTLNSSSLYAFTLSSAFNINKLKRTTHGNEYVKYFLTADAVEFLMGNFSAHYHKEDNAKPKAYQPIMEVNFINKKLTDLLRTAPQFVRTFLTVTVILTARISSSYNETYCISTGDYFAAQTTNATNSSNRKVEHSLNLDTGVLLIERTFIKLVKSWSRHTVRVSLRLSLNSRMWSRSGHHTQLVSNYTLTALGGITEPSFSQTPKPGNSALYVCNTTQTLNHTTLTVYTGMEDIVLASPIVCSNADVQAQSGVIKQREFWEHQTIIPRVTRSDCQNRNYATDHRSIQGFVGILITGPINASHAGTYTFRNLKANNNLTFRYNVEVLTLPTFWGQMVRNSSGNCEHPLALPGAVYANLYKQVDMTCRAPHNTFEFAPVHSYLRIVETSGDDNRWRKMKIKEFAIEKMHVAPKAIDITRSESSLTLALPYVTRKWRKWILTYVCLVEVIGKQLEEKLGVPKYQVETSASIYYHDSGVWPFAKAGTKVVANRIFAALVAAVHWFLNQS